jgi:DNA-binding transcriptional ArsR family regulator
MAMNREIKEACEQKVYVYDDKLKRDVHIFQYVSIYGEEAAIQQLHVPRSPKTSEALSGADGSEPARKKILKPVEYKGNFIGGKKAIKDLIFERARGSRALQNATTLLLYLIQHSAWQGKRDKHKTYNHWYGKKKMIVASRSQEQIAIDLGVSVRSVQRWLDALEKDKLIRRDIEGRENVYIIGVVAGDIEDYFYAMDKARLIGIEENYDDYQT